MPGVFVIIEGNEDGDIIRLLGVATSEHMRDKIVQARLDEAKKDGYDDSHIVDLTDRIDWTDVLPDELLKYSTEKTNLYRMAFGG